VSYTGGSHHMDLALLASPVVINPSISGLTSLSVNLGGNVTSAGSSSLIKRGILYSSTNSNPTLGGTGVIEVDDAAATTGTFSEHINGLTPGTHYYYVAFAQNSLGVTYTTPVSEFTSLTTGATSITGPSYGQRNHALTFTLLAWDPAPGMQNYYFVFKIKWGDGKSDNVTAHSGATFNHTYTANGTYVITITATDARGTTLPAGTMTVVVGSNPPPSLGLFSLGDNSSKSTLTSFAAPGSSSNSSSNGSTGGTLNDVLTQESSNDSGVNFLASILASGNSKKNDSVLDSLFGNIG
jgi:hypothetical protein